MTQAEVDTAFLREYVEFSSLGPVAVAECLHARLLEAHGNQDFTAVAHLQVRLHAEMVLSLETTGAFLRAYSQWDDPDGILGSLLSYAPGDVPKFIEKLRTARDTLSLLCLPTKDDVLAHYDSPGPIETTYTSDKLKQEIMDTCNMYLSEDVRGAYNKIKHGGLCVRRPEMLRPTLGKIDHGDVYVMLYRKAAKLLDFACFCVTGDAGRRMADKYVNNIREITRRSKGLAGFVASCLERNLLRPSR